MHPFPESPADASKYALESLGAAVVGGDVGRAHFRDAMWNLVGAFGAAGDDSAAIRRTLVESAAPRLEKLRLETSVYEGVTLRQAEMTEDVNWFDLATRRSALELLRTEFRGTQAENLVNEPIIAEIDEDLRRLGKLYGPIKLEYVPPMLPTSHWWWRFPT